MKRYIKGSSDEEYFNKLIKRIDEDGYTCFIIQTTGEDDYWYWVVDTPIVENSGLTDIEFINDVTGEYSTEGSSVASFTTPEEAEADFIGDSSNSIESTTSVKASAELDERFSFELDPEFEIYLDTLAKPINCYLIESEVFEGGAGMRYTVAVAVPSEDVHWQIKDDIERNLEKYIKEQTDGSDYTGWVETSDFKDTTYDIPDEVFDDCIAYAYDICVVAYQNISPWGEYGIDYGTEDYLDHVTKGTPFPREE